MVLRSLKLTDDEIQRLLTQAFRETGYRLERHDPILAQYVIQKTLLHDFDESQRSLFSEFTDRIMPTLKDETKKLEAQRERLWSLARSAAEEVVLNAGQEYTKQISNTIHQTDTALLKNLDRHITRLRGEQNSLLEKLEKKHLAFADTASQFVEHMTYISIGSAIFFSILVFIFVKFFTP